MVGRPICEVIKCLTESLQPHRPKPLPDHGIIHLLSNKNIELSQPDLQSINRIAGAMPKTMTQRTMFFLVNIDVAHFSVP